MEFFDIKINSAVSNYFRDILKNNISLKEANKRMYESFGIIQFFDNDSDFQTLKENLFAKEGKDLITDRSEYGDFQTNLTLAENIVIHLNNKKISPKIIIEPTCGEGSFIIASLKQFKNTEHIIGVEIYKPYIWECKFNIIDYYLNNTVESKPDISIIHCNVFDFDFDEIANKYVLDDILILGNPPWVTNSKLSVLNSSNLPVKTNFKKHNGIDAITGKGNFDIAEYITLMIIRSFQNLNGDIALLVKNTVIKNILFDQLSNNFNISEIEKYRIDSKKEFNASVQASLFYCKLNTVPSFICKEYDFYNQKNKSFKFGWLNDKFVSNIDTYLNAGLIDGKSPFEWRQGIKHDCSKVMELDKINNHYENKLNEKVYLENGLIYAFIKSSDLKDTVIKETRKYTIVPQKKVGEETNYIESDYPKTFKYLIDHIEYFNARKSSIYKNKPLFSIFGIGDYSFKPYKVAISGLYKTFHFTLILPQNDKPIMVDDTCYMLGFDKLDFAVYTLMLLNDDRSKQLLKSITFSDAKRKFTKDVLMRIDLLELAITTDRTNLKVEIDKLNKKYDLNVGLDLWESFLDEMRKTNDQKQTKI